MLSIGRAHVICARACRAFVVRTNKLFSLSLGTCSVTSAGVLSCMEQYCCSRPSSFLNISGRCLRAYLQRFESHKGCSVSLSSSLLSASSTLSFMYITSAHLSGWGDDFTDTSAGSTCSKPSVHSTIPKWRQSISAHVSVLRTIVRFLFNSRYVVGKGSA